MKKRDIHIVILGAGFAGLHTAQTLQDHFKKFENSPIHRCKITLIDKKNVHLFRADLYEVATAFHKEITNKCLQKLASTVATPVDKLVDKEIIDFVLDEVEEINPKNKKIILKKRKEIQYDYLVCSIGSITNFFGIPGLEEHALPIKTIDDGLKINCHLDQFFKRKWEEKSKEQIHITIGGGGATGVEMTGELTGALDKLCKKYSFPRDKIKLQLIELSYSLGGMNKRGTQKIIKHFEKNGVDLYLTHKIKKLEADSVHVETVDGKAKKLPSDLFIWTGGVKVHPVIQGALGTPDTRGAAPVNPFLQHVDHPEIFAAGDCAFFPDPQHGERRLPMLAWIAVQQGNRIAKNLARLLENRPLKAFTLHSEPFLLPIGRNKAMWQMGNIILTGKWVWILRRRLTLKYLKSIMAKKDALKKWKTGQEIFAEND